jgi:hypothetical protein
VLSISCRYLQPVAGIMLLDRETTFASFDFGLDRRLVKAVARMGFVYPTLVSTKSCQAPINYDDKVYYICI